MTQTRPRPFVATAGRLLVACVLCVVTSCAEPEVRLADGTGTSWAAWNGKWLLVNYWAEWCAPCRKEIPELNRISREGNGVVVLGVNFDGLRGEVLTRVMRKMDVAFPVLLDDPGARWGREPPSVLPSTLVISPDGELQNVLVGPQTYESLARAVEMTAQM